MSWPEKTPSSIIVRMPNWIGDLVMATPVLAALRNHYPQAAITAMCQKNVYPIITHDPNIDEVFSFKRPSGWIHRRQHLAIIEPLRKGEYDLGILLTNSFSSALWFWRGRVKNRLGFSNGIRNLLLDKAIPFPKDLETRHLTDVYKSLLTPLGIGHPPDSPKLYLSVNEIQEAKDLLQKCGIEWGRHTIIGINPGAAYGSAKCWLPERFQEITKRLLENPNNYVIYFGDNAGAPLVRSICENFRERVIDLAGKTSLRQLMALIHCCTVFLTNDSGPMHIAAALNVPLLALFGSTNEIKTGPRPAGTVIHKHVECSPCYKRVCPIDFRCMKRIGTEEVYHELMRILKESESSK